MKKHDWLVILQLLGIIVGLLVAAWLLSSCHRTYNRRMYEYGKNDEYRQHIDDYYDNLDHAMERSKELMDKYSDIYKEEQ